MNNTLSPAPAVIIGGAAVATGVGVGAAVNALLK